MLEFFSSQLLNDPKPAIFGHKAMEEGGIKIICDNRKARHNYALEERYEAGLSLLGTEVKALREGKANLTDSYAIFKGTDLFLLNCNISPYSMGNIQNHEPTRTRKLLLHRSELNKLSGKLQTRGYSLIPTKLYFRKGRVKVEVALARPKKLHDKRRTIKDRENRREMDRAIRRSR